MAAKTRPVVVVSRDDPHPPQALILTLLILLLLGLFIKRIQQREPLNPLKILHIAGHQRQPVCQRCPCHEGITEGHFPLLAECYRAIKDGLRKGQDLREAKERFQILPLLFWGSGSSEIPLLLMGTLTRTASYGISLSRQFRQHNRIGNEGIEQAAVGVLLGFDGSFKLITEGHEFVDFGDDTMLYGKGW